MYSFDEVKDYDLELANAMEDELARQRDHIELIASENFVSKAVMAAMGSPLTNKYAEGYPGKKLPAVFCSREIFIHIHYKIITQRN